MLKTHQARIATSGGMWVAATTLVVAGSRDGRLTTFGRLGYLAGMAAGTMTVVSHIARLHHLAATAFETGFLAGMERSDPQDPNIE